MDATHSSQLAGGCHLVCPQPEAEERTVVPRPFVTVVIPVYNESRRIGPTLDAWMHYAASCPGDVEILVVDDGSSDVTCSVVRQHVGWPSCIRLQQLGSHRGKGCALRAGLAGATGRFICYTDADLPVDPTALPGFASALVDCPAEVAIAVRLEPAAGDCPISRRVASAVCRWVVRTFVLPEITDSQCGFKVMDRLAVGPLLGSLTIDGFAFDVELLRACLDAGLRVVEIPTTAVHRPGSTVRLWRDARAMLWDLIRIAIRYRGVRGSLWAAAD